jgi:signal transduction histidine kinase
MSDPDGRALREGGFEFFGAIAASLSHELNNVLATVNQLTGLVDDQVTAAEHGRPLDPARLGKATHRIATQLQRGEGYVRQLNRFAHSADHPVASLDARVEVEEMVALCGRFYRLRNVTLESLLPPDPVVLSNSPFGFRHAVYRCLELALAAAAAGSRVAIELRPHNGGGCVEVKGETPVERSQVEQDQKTQHRLMLLRLLAAVLGGTVETSVEPGKPLGLVLSVPSGSAAAGDASD